MTQNNIDEVNNELTALNEDIHNDIDVADSVAELTEKTVEKQSKPWQFKKGQSGNPNGRPKGSLSITAKLREFLDNNPERFDELVMEYLSDKKHRDLLWRMFDGNPKNQTDITSNGNPIPILSMALADEKPEEKAQ
jgi:hypothetical protein